MGFSAYEDIKESEVDWIGGVPSHWKVRRLKYVARLLTDKSDERERAIGLENIEGWTGRYIETEAEFEGNGVDFDEGDLLFGKLRPYLAKVWLAEFEGEAVGDFHVMRPSEDSCGRFLVYQLLNRDFISIVDGSTFGAKMPRASWDFMADMPMPAPPLPEQTAIASFLDRETSKIDSLVSEQRRLIELLKEKRQAVISHAVTKGLNPNAKMKPSGIPWLGDVPEHWEVMRVKHLTASIKAGPFGSALTKDVYVPSGYRVYGQEQVIPNDFTIGDYYIDHAKYEELSQCRVAPGDVLISCVGTFGKIAIVPKYAEPGIINPRLLRLRCNSSTNAQYFVEVLRSKITFEQFSLLSRGGTMDVINIGTLSAVVVPLPPKDEQAELVAFIAKEIKSFDTLQSQAERAIELLQERRNALISAAVTGKIDVRGYKPSDAMI